MFKISNSSSDDKNQLLISKLYRFVLAIAALVVISLLTSSDGSPIKHTISNSWEGFIWGVADPVISLDRLAGIVAIGLLSARFLRGVWISLAFVLAAFAGQIIHLCYFSSVSAEIAIPTVSGAIAIFTILFGVILFLPNQIGFLTCTIISIGAGLFQGYADSEVIINADVLTTITYLIGVTLAQTVIIMSAREINTIISKETTNQIVTKTIRWSGLILCSIGIVFLGQVIT